MHERDDVTLGELKRLLQLQGADIKEIKTDVKAQSGRLAAVEKDVVRIKAYWTAGVFSLGVFGGYLRTKLGL